MLSCLSVPFILFLLHCLLIHLLFFYLLLLLFILLHSHLPLSFSLFPLLSPFLPHPPRLPSSLPSLPPPLRILSYFFTCIHVSALYCVKISFIIAVCISQHFVREAEINAWLSFCTGIVTHTMTWKRMKIKT